MDDKSCPLCGKPLDDDHNLCADCRSYVDTADFIQVTNQESTIAKSDIDCPAIPNKTNDISRTTRKKKMSKTLMFILIGCVLIVVLGIISVIDIKHERESEAFEQQIWDSCVVINTPLSYAKYLVQFRNGIHVEEAHKKIRELREQEESAWKNLKKSSDINDYYNYLATNPSTPYLKSIRIKMDSLLWETTISLDTRDAYKAYLENVQLENITGVYSKIAKQRYEYLSSIKPIEGPLLDSIKSQIVLGFVNVSALNENSIEIFFAPSTEYYGTTLKSNELISHIQKQNKEKGIKHTNMQADRKSIKATKDNKDLVLVDLLLNKEEISLSNKKKYSVDTIQIRLNYSNQIESIRKKQ